jgi:hypothetical protein
MAGLIAIGYNVTVASSIQGFWKAFEDGRSFDIVITDYDGAYLLLCTYHHIFFVNLITMFPMIAGLGTAENTGHFPREHCKYFIVDWYGTEKEYNDNRRRLDLKRILTPFPYDGVNTPIHFMLSGEVGRQQPREQSGMLWAKDPRHLPRNAELLLGALSKLAPLHSFLSAVPAEYEHVLINHKIVSRSEFVQRLRRSRFIIGMG